MGATMVDARVYGELETREYDVYGRYRVDLIWPFLQEEIDALGSEEDAMVRSS